MICLRIAWLRFRFFISEGFSNLWFFFTSDKIPDFSQVFVNLRRAFSKDSPGLTITPVMGCRIHLNSDFFQSNVMVSMYQAAGVMSRNNAAPGAFSALISKNPAFSLNLSESMSYRVPKTSVGRRQKPPCRPKPGPGKRAQTAQWAFILYYFRLAMGGS